MKKLIDMLHQMLMISTGILFLVGIEGFVAFLQGEGDRFSLPWYQPLAILFTGFLCSLMTCILPFDRELSRGRWIAQIAAHFLINLVIVLLMGSLAKWYDDRLGFFVVLSFYVMIYAFVWAGMLWFARYEERIINQALKKMCDKE